MKALIVATTVVIATVFTMAGVCEEQMVVDIVRTVERGGLRYEVNSETPFTGTAVEYWPNGQKLAEGKFRDGKLHGRGIFWYESGQKEGELEFRDGEPHGKWIEWYENGQKKSEVEYLDGEEISRKEWNEDGTPM